MRILSFCLIVLMALSIATLSYAQTSDVSSGSAGAAKVTTKAALNNKPGMKAERGVKNILFGWTDIPKSIIQVTRDSKNPFWGLTAGTLKGVGKAFPRTVSGIADVISFPIGGYDKMPVKPDEWKTNIR